MKFDVLENLKIIRKIKNLKNFSDSKEFLAEIRNKLEIYIEENPVDHFSVIKAEDSRLLSLERSFLIIFNKLKHSKLMPALIIALIAVLGGGGAGLAAQGSVPGDVLYPVKTLTEEARTVVAFSTEKKAELQTEFAEKRAKEVKEILAKEGVDSKNLGLALKNLKKNVARAAEMVVRAQEKKADGQLAKRIAEKLDASKAAIEEALDAEKDELAAKTDELSDDLVEAEEAGDEAKAEKVEKEIADVEADEDALAEEEAKVEDETEEDVDKIEKAMEAKEAAEKAIAEAMEAKEAAIAELGELDEVMQAVVDEALARFSDFMVKAEEALEKEHYVQARQHAVQAETSLKHVVRAVEKEIKKQERADRKAELKAKIEERKAGLKSRIEERKGRATSTESVDNDAVQPDDVEVTTADEAEEADEAE